MFSISVTLPQSVVTSIRFQHFSKKDPVGGHSTAVRLHRPPRPGKQPLIPILSAQSLNSARPEIRSKLKADAGPSPKGCGRGARAGGAGLMRWRNVLVAGVLGATGSGCGGGVLGHSL